MGTKIHLNFEDYGDGDPIILIHGWPLSLKSWENQIPFLTEKGYRVIAYDRRGFGDSATPWTGYSYDTLADDLHCMIEDLNLDRVVLVGFSMGGGEVIKYLSKYGSDKVSKAVLVSSIIPLVKQKDDNTDGIPAEVLENILKDLKKNRLHFLKGFLNDFYNCNEDNKIVSEEQLQNDYAIASKAAPHATLHCANSWMEADFREECKNIDTEVLIIHGDADKTVPLNTAAKQAHQLLKKSKLLVYENAPHGLNVTHAERLNSDIYEFLQQA